MSLVAVGGAGGVYLLVNRGPSHPKAWDPRVVSMVQFVEEKRGLNFDHPVKIEFLEDNEFESHLGMHDSSLTEQDRIEIEQSEAELRALGLIGGDTDLVASYQQADQTSTVGLYTPSEDVMRIRGTDLNAFVRETVVHELTHALQDQHFDISRKSRVEEDALFDVVVEGDAQRIADAYVEDYSTSEFDEYFAIAEDFERDAEKVLNGIPDVVRQSMGFPYAVGPAFMATLDAYGGADAVAGAFAAPPATEEQILDIRRYLAKEPSTNVDGYELRNGETEISSDDFGMSGLAALLSGRVEETTAYHALNGWAGDTYVTLEREGTVCVEATVEMENEAEATELREAFQSWSRDVEGSHLEQQGSTVRFGACDPGDRAHAPPVAEASALTLFAIRGSLVLDVVADDGNLDHGYCFFEELLRQGGTELFYSAELSPQQDQIIANAFETCRL